MSTDPALQASLELLTRGHRLYTRTDPQPTRIAGDRPRPPERTDVRSRRLADALRAATATDAELTQLIRTARADHAAGRADTRAVLEDARADRPAGWDTPLGRREAARRMVGRLRTQHHRIAESHRHTRRLARRVSGLHYRRAAPAGGIADQIRAALDRLGIHDPAARRRWLRGYQTLIARESSGRPSAVAAERGPTWPDGHRPGYARGLTQTIPETFARYHQPGTSPDINDPIANICASMNYVMHRYRVSPDGSNLAALVQQVDPHRPPKGY